MSLTVDLTHGGCGPTTRFFQHLGDSANRLSPVSSCRRERKRAFSCNDSYSTPHSTWSSRCTTTRNSIHCTSVTATCSTSTSGSSFAVATSLQVQVSTSDAQKTEETPIRTPRKIRRHCGTYNEAHNSNSLSSTTATSGSTVDSSDDEENDEANGMVASLLPAVSSLMTTVKRTPVTKSRPSDSTPSPHFTPPPVASESAGTATPPPENSPKVMPESERVEWKDPHHLAPVSLPLMTCRIMKSLPHHSLVKMKLHGNMPRQLLPPKTSTKKVTLVLDLDETLVHCDFTPQEGADIKVELQYGGQPYKVFGRRRPHLATFLREASRHFEVVCFTASQRLYAEQIIRLIDPDGHITNCLFRDACIPVRGNFLKDLSLLGRDLKNTILLDNSPLAFSYQLENGVPIESWFDDANDTNLLSTMAWLKTLSTVDDVRPYIREKFRMRERVHRTFGSPVQRRESPRSQWL